MRGVSPQKTAQRAQLLEDLLATLLQAGAQGLTPTQLADSHGLARTANIVRTLNALEAAGRLYLLRRHPVAVLYHAQVSPAAAAAAFEARCAAELAQRADKRRQTMGANGTVPGYKTGSRAPQLTRRRNSSLQAVDPQALRPDAKVTTPPHVQVQHCPHGVDRRIAVDPSHRGPLSSLPPGRYPEAVSTWAAALTEERRHA